MIASALVMHQQRDNDDDGQWNSDQPKKHTSTEAHGILLFLILAYKTA
jgi:hypothetical protein